MPVQAQLRFVRIQPTKVRLAARLISGKPVQEALAILSLLPNRAARLLHKVVTSAVANATNNNELDADDLYVHTVTADQGPSYGRLKPRARGRADVIRRQTTHVRVVLAERSERSER